MISNSSWRSAAWVDAKKALAGSELLRGGGPKLADSCHNHWTSVHHLQLSFLCTVVTFPCTLLKLKKEYVAIRDLQAMSGFGWDDALSIVIAPDDVWDRLIAVGPPFIVMFQFFK